MGRKWRKTEEEVGKEKWREGKRREGKEETGKEEGRGSPLLILDTPLLLYDHSDILSLLQCRKTVTMKLALIKLKNYTYFCQLY